MSKPAARIGDMHVCPMVTPGTPPIPHVGGPVTGPGVATVHIGGVPAAVMGDMCVCTGPPDSIVLGSTGVLIGGKPAARMGDSCSHGGTITVGCPTVLIGEVGSGGGGMAMAKTVMNTISATVGEAVALVKAQEVSLLNAAAEGLPFCEICEKIANEQEEEEEEKKTPPAKEKEDEEEDLKKKIKKLYFVDDNDKKIHKLDEDAKSVFLVIESENVSGEEVIVNLYDQDGDFTYNGADIKNNQLTVKPSSDVYKIKLDLKLKSK